MVNDRCLSQAIDVQIYEGIVYEGILPQTVMETLVGTIQPKCVW